MVLGCLEASDFQSDSVIQLDQKKLTLTKNTGFTSIGW